MFIISEILITLFINIRIGLFERSDWLAYRRIIKSLLRDPTVLKMWDNQSHVFSKEFKLEVELILGGNRTPTCEIVLIFEIHILKHMPS